ncbi:MAG: hypothetical protein IKV82_08820 [Akkermansia sp.]|nr:hypothetical protein [Akkermansia sp.]
MKFSLNLLLAACLMLGILAPMPADAAPSRKSAKHATNGKKKTEKTKRKKAVKQAFLEKVFPVINAPLLTGTDFKNPPADVRKEAKERLEKLGIIPDIYEDALKLAVYDGSVSLLQFLLLAGQEQAALDKAFELAITHTPNPTSLPNDNRASCAKMLLEAGACASELTPQHLMACRDQKLDTYARSLPQYKPGNTLRDALCSGDYETIRQLTDNGEKIDMVPKDRNIPVMTIPFLKDDPQAMQLLMSVPNVQNLPPERVAPQFLTIAVQTRAVACIKALLKSGLEIYPRKVLESQILKARPGVYTPQMTEDVLLPFIEAGICTKFDALFNKQILDYTLCKGFGKCIVPLSKGSELSPLIPAIAADDDKALEQLLAEEKPDLNKSIWHNDKAEHTPLSLAAACGSSKCLSLLLKQPGININLPVQSDFSQNKVTPLAHAVHNNHTKCAAKLIKDPGFDATNNDNLLHIITGNNPKIMGLFLLHPDADINTPIETNPDAPMHPVLVGISSFQLSNMLVLVNTKGLNINNRSTGETPLHTAILYGNTVAMQLLLASGANPGITDKNNLNCTDFLAQHGASLPSASRFTTFRHVNGQRPNWDEETINNKARELLSSHAEKSKAK